MFVGFAEHDLPTERGTVFACVGGSGQPLLFLHGYPQNHLMWHAAAGFLSRRLGAPGQRSGDADQSLSRRR
jgi:haloacetate dehalogenase